MEQICQDVPFELCNSLSIISCCDFFQSIENDNDNYNDNDNENKNDNNAVNDKNSWSFYGYIRSNKFFKLHTNESIQSVINNEDDDKNNLIQFLHDLSIQIRHLHFAGFTFTDVEGSDIIEVDGHFGIINVNKLVKFDKSTQYANLTYPIYFGKFIAPELVRVKHIPTYNAIHKNSVLWSIGRMVVHFLFDHENENENENENDDWSIYLSKFNHSGIIPILIRCLNFDPEQRMLLVI